MVAHPVENASDLQQAIGGVCSWAMGWTPPTVSLLMLSTCSMRPRVAKDWQECLHYYA